MSGKQSIWYGVVVVAALVMFGVSLAGGYWFARRGLSGPASMPDNAEPTNIASPPRVLLQGATARVDEVKLQDVVERVDDLTTGKSLQLTVMEAVPARAEMQMFHASEVGETSAYGCGWREDGSSLQMTLYVDRQRLVEVFADVAERNQVLSKFLVTCIAKSGNAAMYTEEQMQDFYAEVEARLAESDGIVEIL